MTSMSDYSTYKNGLDIVEALTKRLDRLTGFDAELDNILGGQGDYGQSLYDKHDLSGKHICEQNFKEHQPELQESQEIEQSSTSVDHNHSTAAQCQTSTLNSKTLNSEHITCFSDINLSADCKKSLPTQSDLLEKLKSSSFDEPAYREICHSHHPTENTSKDCSPQISSSPRLDERFLAGIRDSGGSVLKRFLSIPSDGEASGSGSHSREIVTSAGVSDINSTLHYDQQYEQVPDEHWVDAAALQSALAQHILNVESENSKFRGEPSYELLTNRSQDHWSDGKGINSEFYRPFPVYNLKAHTGLETSEKIHSDFSPAMVDLCPERINASSFYTQKSYLKAETYKCSSSRIENSSMAEDPSVRCSEILNTVDRNYFSLTKDAEQGAFNLHEDDHEGIEKFFNEVALSEEGTLSCLPFIDHVPVLKECKFSYSTSIDRSSVADPEDFFTASEGSGTTTPSFLTARDRESVLSWKSFNSEVASAGRGRSFRMTPVMKDISEIFMTKSFTNDYQNRIDSHKNVDYGENTSPLPSSSPHHQSRGEEDAMYVNHLQESPQGSLKEERCFTTLEEVQQTHLLKLSPLQGCTLTREVLSCEQPLHTGQDGNLRGRIVQEDVKEQPVTVGAFQPLRGLYTTRSERSDHLMESQPSNSFSTIEEVRDVQHIKLSPLEGCSLHSQVTTEEFSPHQYLSLSSSGQAMTSSEQDRIITSSEQNRIMTSSEQNRTLTSSEQNRTLTSPEQNRIMTSSEQTRSLTSPEQNIVLPITFNRDTRKDWNRDELSMFNPEISQTSNSFSTIEEVRDVQHIKLSPLEGCSLHSQVTTEEFSPHQYLSLNSSGRAMTSSEQNRVMTSSEQNRIMTSSEQNRTMTSSEQNRTLTKEQERIMTSSEEQNRSLTSPEQNMVLPITFNSESRKGEEKWKDWNRDEMAMFNPDISQPSNSFCTIEEVRDVQHIKLSPLEGCSLHSQVTTEEFSPHHYLSLSSSGRAMTSSEQNRIMTSSEQDRIMTKEQVRIMSSSEEHNRTLTSPEQNMVLPITFNSESRKEEEKWKDWNRDEMAMFNPDISQPSNSFCTIEEVRDVQHIKLSPLEGCSLHSQVTTEEFSPHHYLSLSRGDKTSELDRQF